MREASGEPGDAVVCLCFGVPERKLVNHCRRERPRHASQLSECLGAGTGCGWCVPLITRLHRAVMADPDGAADVTLGIDPAAHAAGRAAHRRRR